MISAILDSDSSTVILFLIDVTLIIYVNYVDFIEVKFLNPRKYQTQGHPCYKNFWIFSVFLQHVSAKKQSYRF